MDKINFQNLPNTTTPVNANNLNTMQNNIENVINACAPLNTTPQTINGDTQITFMQLSYNSGWKLYLKAITQGEEHSFEADLTQLD